MKREKRLQSTATYERGVRRTLRLVIDFMAATAAIACILLSTRIADHGPAFILTITLIFASGVLPSIILRDDKFLPLRGGLIVLGIGLSSLSGISQLGLVAGAFAAIPFIMALSAMLFEKRTTFVFLALYSCALIVLSFLFTSGNLEGPQISLTEWNTDTGNWVIKITAVSFTSFMVIILIYTQRQNWRATDLEAIEKTQQFETLVEYAPDAITILDFETGNFVAVNRRAEQLFGKPRDVLVNGPSVAELSPQNQSSGESSAELAGKYVRQALDGGHPLFEWQHLGPDGETVPCEVSLSRIPPLNRQLVRANIVDISSRLANQKQHDALQDQLAAAQRLEAIGQLTGGVAHDFNNLLAIILGNLELLQDESKDPLLKTRLQPCIDATLRGADLTRSMLNYARKAQLEPKPTDLNKLVRETKNWAGRTLPSNIEIETSLLARLWTVETDPSVAESALLNLILNARDAMPSGGKLTIETSNIRIDSDYFDGRQEEIAPGRYVLVAVSDTGFGISQEMLQKVFDPFVTTKAPGDGSGLGLPMVLGFMRQSGGTVQVYSEEGVGTTFKLYFPAIEANATSLEVASADQFVSGQGKRILVAEDEEDVLSILTAMLSAAGYEVNGAASGDAAKAMFEADPSFDLLLTDIVMPGHLQGTTLAKELRATNDALPVVFMSGYASEATVHGNGLRPTDIRLMKPVMRRELLDALARALSGN